jgi:adenylate kinase
MRIIITGTPGTGKSSVAKALGRRIKCMVVNEKQFALEKKIGKWDEGESELVIPLQQFARELNKLLAKEKNIILEGHLLCELRLPKADFVVLLTVKPEELEKRLQAKGYSELKVQENVFCEANDYCKKRVLRSYNKQKVLQVATGKTIKEITLDIISKLREKGAKI